MKILFVCKYNRFRSKVAEAYFRKINRNRNIKFSSAGVFKGYPTPKVVVEIGKKLGIKIKKRTKGLREQYLNEFDLFVVVANNIPKCLFNTAKKVIWWSIPDTSQSNKKDIERIMKRIFKRVDELNKELNGKRK